MSAFILIFGVVFLRIKIVKIIKLAHLSKIKVGIKIVECS